MPLVLALTLQPAAAALPYHPSPRLSFSRRVDARVTLPSDLELGHVPVGVVRARRGDSWNEHCVSRPSGCDFSSINVMEHPTIREGIKKYSYVLAGALA